MHNFVHSVCSETHTQSAVCYQTIVMIDKINTFLCLSADLCVSVKWIHIVTALHFSEPHAHDQRLFMLNIKEEVRWE